MNTEAGEFKISSHLPPPHQPGFAQGPSMHLGVVAAERLHKPASAEAFSWEGHWEAPRPPGPLLREAVQALPWGLCSPSGLASHFSH